jgi:hypothetical protein
VERDRLKTVARYQTIGRTEIDDGIRTYANARRHTPPRHTRSRDSGKHKEYERRILSGLSYATHLNSHVRRLTVRGKVLYNPFMNKRAKKRLKESIEKDNQKRAEIRKEQNPSSPKEFQESRGFTPKPAKKRG